MSPSVAGQKTYNIASIPADGIGPEVIEAGITALNALTDTLKTFKLEFKNYDWSSETFKKTGKYIPDGGLEELKKHDAIFFGAVGAPGKKTSLIQIACNLQFQMSPTTSPCGAFVWPSASHFSNTPTCVPLVSSAVLSHPCASAVPMTLTG